MVGWFGAIVKHEIEEETGFCSLTRDVRCGLLASRKLLSLEKRQINLAFCSLTRDVRCGLLASRKLLSLEKPQINLGFCSLTRNFVS